MRKVYEMLVVRGKRDSLLALRVLDMCEQDVVEEEMRLWRYVSVLRLFAQ